ncbi:threonine ammonia-lyase [Neptunicoccus cionae]|uniref:Serine/threonine dehydratase n=1 Tax=Neptunicoccus cionae TaxID=2035344 RepID=A0A916QWM8_9RHOB|nr:threonine/serine dehydratase [Amylibacter cionae]GGA15546.1 serine/threonine dehydratase [Amylibacter cionae]
MSTIQMLKAAEKRLKGHARRTPMLTSPFLDDIAGRRVLVKAECLQHTGSFKYRGAWSAISALPKEVRRNGVIAYSSGNHAQGVALAASQHKIKAVIVMPSDAPKIKIDNTKALGAKVVLYDRETESREEAAEKANADGSLTLIKPFDDPEVIAGQGSTGIEIVFQAKDLKVRDAEVLVPTGGGGLASGIALALKEYAQLLRVRTCEPQDFDDYAHSLRAGRPVVNKRLSGSLCDAIITPTPGLLTFPILNRLAGPGMVVTEDECLHAMALAFHRLRIVLEPGGAAGLAAALFHGDQIDGDAVIAVATGGNVDKEVFEMALAKFGDI